MKSILQLSMLLFATISFGQAPTNGLIGYYGFENNYNSHNLNHNFINNSIVLPAVPFVIGKYGQGASFAANNQYLINTSLNSVILSNSDISFCFWQKTTNVADQYKTTAEFFGSLYFRNFNNANIVGVSPDGFQFPEGVAENNSQNNYGIWKHYAITTATISGLRYLRIYIDGQIINNIPFSALHKFTSAVTIGAGTDANTNLVSSKRFSGVIDEFYIYNRALTTTEINNLKDANTLSYYNFNTNNLKFSMHPNPANSFLNIDIESEIESVEVYSLESQKVLSATEKQVNISSLSSGIYMVKVADENGAIATQKLVKN